MNVGVYTQDIAPDVGGGFTFEEEVRLALLRNRDHSRHEIIFLKGPGSHSTAKPTLKHLIKNYLPRPVVRTARRFFPSPIPKSESTIQRTLQEKKIDILFNLVPMKTFSFDVPYIQLVWDLQHRLQPHFPEMCRNGEWDARERVVAPLLRRAAIVITGTEVGKKEIESFYQVPSERIRLLPHPTPEFALKASPSPKGILQKFNLPDEFLFYPAQFWPHKNHVGLLKALEILRHDFQTTFSLAFVGGDQGNLSYVKETVAKMSLESQVFFLGFVDRKELVALYQNALALTYASFCGPENLPPLEAFALGCPVISSRVSGAVEQLGDAAFLVDPKNPKAMAEAIYRLKNEPALRSNLVSRGLKRAKEFTADNFVSKLFEIFDELEPIRECWCNYSGVFASARKDTSENLAFPSEYANKKE